MSQPLYTNRHSVLPSHLRVQGVDSAVDDDDLLYSSSSYYSRSFSPLSDIAVGTLLLTLTLGSYSLTELSDDNPMDILDFIANIGGFWGECIRFLWLRDFDMVGAY